MCFSELKWWRWVISSGIHLFGLCSGIWNAKGWESKIGAFGLLPTQYILYSTKYFPPPKATYGVTPAIYRDLLISCIAAQPPDSLQNPNWALQTYLISHRKPTLLSLVKEILFLNQSQLRAVRIQQLYHSGSHAHWCTRQTKCLGTKIKTRTSTDKLLETSQPTT